MMTVLTDEQSYHLEIARGLVEAGIPIFLARPAPDAPTGFALPTGWQHTRAEGGPNCLSAWAPGMAVCAVMGHGLDLIDIDPRNGGDLNALGTAIPRVYAIAATPSGGYHVFVASLGAGSHDAVFPGVDVKGGYPDGSSRGFAFIAPTQRVSKVDGELGKYVWAQPPDLIGLREFLRDRATDTSGGALAEQITAVRGASSRGRDCAGPDWWRAFMANRAPQSAAAASRAITNKIAEVAEWDPSAGVGFRTVLMRAALTLGGYVGGDYLDETEGRARLEEAVSAYWGTPDADDLTWIEQGFTDGAAHPFHVWTLADELAAAAPGPDGPDGQPGPPPWTIYDEIGLHPFDPTFANSDQELAKAVATRLFPVLRYATDAETWLERRPAVWKERGDLAAWAISTVAELMPVGESPIPKKLEDRTEGHWQANRRAKFMDSPGAGKVEKKLRAVIRNDYQNGLELADLDAHPEVLWAGGVPWDLRASAHGPVAAGMDPRTPHLRTALCAPLSVETPTWDRFIASVFPDAAVRAWAMRVLSISLAGYADAALPVLYGPERTGKTSLAALLVQILGSYGHAADPRLLGGADSTHASVIYALKGRRVSFIDEGPRKAHLAIERLKQLTGGGQLTGNAMRANPISFTPTHTLVMTTNDEPTLTDPALRARLRVIPCEADRDAVRFSRARLDVLTEAPGVLAKLMAECAAWLADPDSASTHRAPAGLRSAVQDMAEAQDPVREWVAMCTVPAEPGTPGRELYRSFRAWHEGNALYRRTTPPTETAFGRALTEGGYPATKHGRGNDRLKYRPLSVLGGMINLPTGPIRAGTVGGTVGDGSDDRPSPTENPRSSSLFSSFGDSGDSSSSTIKENKQHSPKRSIQEQNIQPNTGNFSTVPDPSVNPGVDLAKGAGGRSEGNLSPTQPPTPEPSVGSPNSDPADPNSAFSPGEPPEGSDSSPSVSGGLTQLSATVAARATERGISKAEARAELKAEARLAAIAHAGGEVVSLPAVVDRAGHVLPVSVDQAAMVVRSAIGRAGALTVDVETTGYPVGHRHYTLRSVQLGDATAAVVLHPVTHAELITTLLDEASWLHAHSATADLVPLAHAGLIDIESGWARMWDTVIPAKLGDPESTGSDPALKKLSGAVLGDASVAPAADAGRDALFKAGRWLKNPKSATPVERSGWAQVTTGCAVMLRYAASDVLDTAALPAALPPIDPEVHQRERAVQRMTALVSHVGLRIDAEQVRATTAGHTSALNEAIERVQAFGVANPGSDQQVGVVAAQLGAELPRTDTGRPSVAAGVLEPLRSAEGELGAFVAAVLDHRHHSTALGTFCEPYQALCTDGDARVRPTVYTLGAASGRMSCVRPNLQQLPRKGGIRAFITADPGNLLISADFRSVELRVAAALSGDDHLKRIIDEGRDLHWEIARQVFGPDATAADRYMVKRGVFGRIYGGGIPTLARQVGASETTIASMVDTLDAMTPGLIAWSRTIREAVQAGNTHFRTYSGRIEHLPMQHPHKAPNYCIQGSARELLVDALLRWRDTRWGKCVLLPVHDELVVSVPDCDAAQATTALESCMTTHLHGVPIVAKASAPSFAWADAE